MKVCLTCQLEKPLDQFPASRTRLGALYYRPHCWPCKYLTHDKGRSKTDVAKDYHRSYYMLNELSAKYKGYRHRHLRFGGGEVIDQDSATQLMMMPCFYCTKESCHGIDRIDNAQGYLPENLRPCCEKCNNILGDIPDQAKLLLVKGLTEIHQQELLKHWTIPTKRTPRK